MGRTGWLRAGAFGGVAALLVGLSVTQWPGARNGEAPRAAAPSSLARPVVSRPNIVVVMADDMRVDDLRFTPLLRGLVAAHGLTFDNSFAPYPLCCPDRASFLTGRYAHNHGVYWHDAPYGYASFDDSRTLATSLRAVGYHTGFVGKYLNGYGHMRSRVSGRPSYRYVPRGWDDWRASIEGAPGVHGGTYNYWDIAFDVNGHVDDSHRGQYSSTVIGDLSVGMERRFARSSRPFFMYVNYVAPHIGAPEPGDPATHVADLHGRVWDYGTPGRPLWVRGRFDSLIRRGAGMPRNGGPAEDNVSDKPPSFRRIPEPTRRERLLMRDVTRQRAESVFVMDKDAARLIRALHRTREWSHTVFMFLSDNGYFLGEHRHRSGKVLAHEPSLRVPFLVTGPGMRTPGHRYDPISVVDVSATILDLAHARPPRPPDGSSRVATMHEGDQGWTTGVVTENAMPGALPVVKGFDDARTMIGVRTARYSLMVNRREGSELYDLAKDPLENHNVYGDPAYRHIQRLLLQAWEALRDCRHLACRTPLPSELRAGPTAERRLTRAYWAAVRAVYGWQ